MVGCLVVKKFLSKVPDAVGVYLHYANDEDRSFGIIDIQQTNIHEQLHAMILEGEHKTIEDREWYIYSIKENETPRKGPNTEPITVNINPFLLEKLFITRSHFRMKIKISVNPTKPAKTRICDAAKAL